MAERKAKTPFVSCIKIRGIHLLPPVITQKRRAELQGYKQQAVKLEKRLKNCRDLKKNLEDLLNMQPLTDRPYSEISFRDDNHVEALGITDKSKEQNSPSETKATRKITLSRDIIDVTQYNNDGIKVYSDGNYETLHQGQYLNHNNTSYKSEEIESTPTKRNNSIEDSDLNSTKSSKCNIDDSSVSLNISASDISPRLEKSPKPRLIRSNSYTLDTPSPILLAHLERTGKSNKQDESSKLEDIKNLSISRNWSSLENNYVPFENSEFNSISTVYNANVNEPDKKGTESNTIDKNVQQNVEKTKSPAINVIQTDISVQNITVNANEDIINDALDQNVATSDSQLLQVLKTLPEVYAKQIIELIESQKQKQREHKNEPRDESLNNPPNSALKNDDCNLHRNVSFSESEKLEGSTTSISPSQSIYYSVTSCDTLRPTSNSSVRLIDLECEETGVTEKKPESETNITEYYVHEEVRTGMNVNRELFPQLDEKTINIIKREWAASVIGAHVKGYLTRRLLKTERVQSLIETIKDALMCALQLHSSENIDESDVELHRRLINQVSAACFTFHDIFFSLTVQEQMLIISTDRQRKMEKAKRPVSAPASRRSKSTSNRSTPRSRLSSHSQSLTKV